MINELKDMIKVGLEPCFFVIYKQFITFRNYINVKQQSSEYGGGRGFHLFNCSIFKL